ncbi:MAG TPA: hypothetical protein VIJ33_00445 [Solirubrobacteraceae bacterium]
MSSVAALFGTLLYAAPALAASPAQDAYGAVSSATGSTGAGTTASGSLPFTGLNLVAILAVAMILLAIGLTVRVRAARNH